MREWQSHTAERAGEMGDIVVAILENVKSHNGCEKTDQENS